MASLWRRQEFVGCSREAGLDTLKSWSIVGRGYFLPDTGPATTRPLDHQTWIIDSGVHYTRNTHLTWGPGLSPGALSVSATDSHQTPLLLDIL